MADKRTFIVTAHQANYLPYLGFFEKILVSDLFVLVDDTQFVKRGAFGWIHRNRILGPNGPMWLTVPVKTHDRYYQKIAEVEINQAQNWQRKHLRSIEIAYRKSPFFKDFFPKLENIYQQKWEYLLSLSQEIIIAILDYLEIKIPVILSSELGIEGEGSDYVLQLAQKSKATHYLSGMHGKDYLDLNKFAEAKMNLIFQDFKCLEYPQPWSETFVSHLSTIDAIFLTGKEGTRQLLLDGSNYEIPK